MSLYVAPKVVVTGLFIALGEYIKKEEEVPWWPGFHCHGRGSIPGQGTEIPQDVQSGQKKKEERLKVNELSIQLKKLDNKQ